METMKTKLIYQIMAVAIAVVALASCSINVKKVKDTEAEQTKTFDVKDFNKISINCGADVEYTVSDSISITVKGTEDWMQTIDFSTADGMLFISKKDDIDGTIHVNVHYGPCRIIISGPSLESVVIAGSGSFTCDGAMQTENFFGSVSGSGDLNIKNMKTMNAQLSVLGSGGMKISGMEAQKCDVSISGSGDVALKANSVQNISTSIVGSGDIVLDCKDCGTASVAISGSGDVRLSGNVRLFNKTVSGSGDIDTSNLKIGE